MEKTAIGGAIAAVVGWLGLLQTGKVDRPACDATHKALCSKLDDIKGDVSYIRTRLDGHLGGGTQ